MEAARSTAIGRGWKYLQIYLIVPVGFQPILVKVPYFLAGQRKICKFLLGGNWSAHPTLCRLSSK